MKYTKTKLKNGLRVILVPMQGTQTVTFMAMVATGSRYETKKNNGISHFLEHMFFKGTEKRPTTLDISEALDAVGGEYNAFTGSDRTAYYAKVDAKHVGLAIDVISDIVLHSKLDAVEIEREKGTILQEMNMYEDMPSRIIHEHFEHLLYGDHPLGWQIIGTKENIMNFKRSDFLRYLNSQYVASNMVLIVSGKLNEKEVIKKIKNCFDSISEGEAKGKKTVRESQTRPAIYVKEKKTDQTHLVLGVRAYDMFHSDRYVLAVLANVLGGNMSSRLFLEVRERRGLAYHVSTGTEEYHDAGYLATQSGVEHSNLEKTVKVILGEYKKISEKPIGKSELEKSKEYLKAKLIMNLEASDDVAGFLIGQEIYDKKIELPADIAKSINKVTAEDVLRVAKDIFRPEKLNLAVIGPHAKSKKLEALLKL